MVYAQFERSPAVSHPSRAEFSSRRPVPTPTRTTTKHPRSDSSQVDLDEIRQYLIDRGAQWEHADPTYEMPFPNE
jgi:hypothetical protein